jgi:hypothetical protein
LPKVNKSACLLSKRRKPEKLLKRESKKTLNELSKVLSHSVKVMNQANLKKKEQRE